MSHKKKSTLMLGISLFLIAILSLFFAFNFTLRLAQTTPLQEKTFFVDSSIDTVELSPYLQLNRRDGASPTLAIDTKIKDIDLVALVDDKGSVYFASKDGRYSILGDVVDNKEAVNLSAVIEAKLYFSKKHEFVKVNDDRKVDVSDETRVLSSSSTFNKDAYEEAVKKKLAKLEAKQPVISGSGVSPQASMVKNHNNPISNDDCLIKFGGFNQPRIGYDESCALLSPSAKKEQIKALMNGFPDEFFVSFKAENEKGEVYVFTDYTCAYCKKLHKNIDGFLNNGITVNYVFYPRAVGMHGQDSFAEEVVVNMSSAWCSDDPASATHQLYKNGSVPYAKCEKDDGKLDSPVRQHYILGMMFEISGTPLIVGSNGETTYGFRSVGTTMSRLKL